MAVNESVTDSFFSSRLWQSLFLVKLQVFTISDCFGRLIKLILTNKEAFVQRCCWKISKNSQENTCAKASFWLTPATLLKKRLWHRCFPHNFAKFLRTPFFIEHLQWLLLETFKTYKINIKSSVTFAYVQSNKRQIIFIKYIKNRNGFPSCFCSVK